MTPYDIAVQTESDKVSAFLRSRGGKSGAIPTASEQTGRSGPKNANSKQQLHHASSFQHDTAQYQNFYTKSLSAEETHQNENKYHESENGALHNGREKTLTYVAERLPLIKKAESFHKNSHRKKQEHSDNAYQKHNLPILNRSSSANKSKSGDLRFYGKLKNETAYLSVRNVAKHEIDLAVSEEATRTEAHQLPRPKQSPEHAVEQPNIIRSNSHDSDVDSDVFYVFDDDDDVHPELTARADSLSDKKTPSSRLEETSSTRASPQILPTEPLVDTEASQPANNNSGAKQLQNGHQRNQAHIKLSNPGYYESTRLNAFFFDSVKQTSGNNGKFDMKQQHSSDGPSKREAILWSINQKTKLAHKPNGKEYAALERHPHGHHNIRFSRSKHNHEHRPNAESDSEESRRHHAQGLRANLHDHSETHEYVNSVSDYSKDELENVKGKLNWKNNFL